MKLLIGTFSLGLGAWAAAPLRSSGGLGMYSEKFIFFRFTKGLSTGGALPMTLGEATRLFCPGWLTLSPRPCFYMAGPASCCALYIC